MLGTMNCFLWSVRNSVKTRPNVSDRTSCNHNSHEEGHRVRLIGATILLRVMQPRRREKARWSAFKVRTASFSGKTYCQDIAYKASFFMHARLEWDPNHLK
jgi:hypothetical protein